jgi:hypothetical protein
VRENVNVITECGHGHVASMWPQPVGS